MSEELGQKKELEKLEKAAEQTSDPEEIEQKAEEQPRPAPAEKKSLYWFVPHALVAAMAGMGILVLDWKPTLFQPSLVDKLDRYLLGILGVVGVLVVGRIVELYLIARLRSAVSRFNLKRILRIVVALVLGFIVISVLFVNWYAAVVSLGLISLSSAIIPPRYRDFLPEGHFFQ